MSSVRTAEFFNLTSTSKHKRSLKMYAQMKTSRLMRMSLVVAASFAAFTASAERRHGEHRDSFFAPQHIAAGGRFADEREHMGDFSRNTISERYLRAHLRSVLDATESLVSHMRPEALADARESVDDTYSELIGLNMREAVEQIRDEADSPIIGPDWCDEDVLDEEPQDFLAIMYWNVCVMSIIDQDWRLKLDASLRRYRVEGGRKPGRPHRVSRHGRSGKSPALAKPAHGEPKGAPAAKPAQGIPKPAQGTPKPAPVAKPENGGPKDAPAAKPAQTMPKPAQGTTKPEHGGLPKPPSGAKPEHGAPRR